MKDIKWNFNEGRVLEIESGAELNHEVYGLTRDRAAQLLSEIFLHGLHVNCIVHGNSLQLHLKKAYEVAETIEEYIYCTSEIYKVQGKNDLLFWISKYDPPLSALILNIAKNIINDKPNLKS
jgi:hypothetical protein